jgi:hypothetical protein
MAMYSRAKGARIRDHAIVAIAAARVTNKGPQYAKAVKEHEKTFGSDEVYAAIPIFDDFFAEAHLT